MELEDKNSSLEEIEKLHGINKEDVLTVSQLNKYVKKVLSDNPRLSRIYVVGEVTGLFRHSSGCLFFRIKDGDSVIKCAYLKKNNRHLEFHLKDGLEILVSGSLVLREKKGIYEIQVYDAYPVGTGISHLKFTQVREKLEKQGLFDEKHKKMIPTLPRSIGLISSEESQGYTDVLEGLKNRFPNVVVKFISAPMQGDRAPGAIGKAISVLNEHQVDIIIIARGGGPAEEMMCFNDEGLARNIFHSRTPIITGIGHEADQTIADLVADQKAATPSMAAKLAVPRKEELVKRIDSSRDRLRKGYDVFIKSVQREKALKRYKVIVAVVIVVAIALGVVLYLTFSNKVSVALLKQGAVAIAKIFETVKTNFLKRGRP